MFDADRPILKSDQDKLGRTIFAKYLARCILDHHDPASLVIGLYGAWGAGKTSVINLVLEELNFAASNLLDTEKPVILNFSAWSYSGQNQLIYSFFRRLSSALRGVSYLENASKIIHLLELYVSFFTHQPIPKKLQSQRSLYKKLTFQDREDIHGWESGRDLTLVKAELNELLHHQKHKIIIIIDNISRLYDYEIKQVFQIVKSMGDYANTSYLLAMDKDQVIQAINKIDGNGGEEFIEKIIQLPFEIPPIHNQDLEKIFADRLNAIIQTIPEGSWNTEYWADIYYGSLKFFFENCRDITRYVNILNFSYARLRDVVNPVDFFALIAIEIFAPKIYFGIRENKDLFTDLLDNVYRRQEPQQLNQEKMRCEEIISRTSRYPRELIYQLLIHLFPRIRKIYSPDELFYHSEMTARKLKRICSPDNFDAYFRLSMQEGQINDSEFETLLSLTSDPEIFDQAIARLNQDDRILKFLALLDSKALNTIPTKNIQAIITAILDNGDLFPPGISGALSLNTSKRIHRIVHRLLRRFEGSEERFVIMQNAIAKSTKSVYILVNELIEQSREHHEESDIFLPREYRDLTPEQLDSLQKLVASRIANWASNGSLIDHPKLLPLLFAWCDWGNSEECKNFVNEVTQTDRGLLAFLSATLEKAIDQAMTQYEKNLAWEKYLENINAFVPADSLESHAKILFEDQYFEKLREREQLALMIFLDLIKSSTKKFIPNTST